jgi:hypothetical protein
MSIVVALSIYGNPNCGTLIIFHKDAKGQSRGEEIDWEGEYIMLLWIRLDYITNSSFFRYASPRINCLS